MISDLYEDYVVFTSLLLVQLDPASKDPFYRNDVLYLLNLCEGNFVEHPSFTDDKIQFSIERGILIDYGVHK